MQHCDSRPAWSVGLHVSSVRRSRTFLHPMRARWLRFISFGMISASVLLRRQSASPPLLNQTGSHQRFHMSSFVQVGDDFDRGV